MNVIISIGGSGSICVDTLHRLAAAGLLQGDYRLLILDKDMLCGNTGRCENNLERYKAAADIGMNEDCYTASFKAYQWRLDDALKELAGADLLSTANIRQILNPLQGDAESGRINKALLNMLLSQDEQETPLDKGFYGHPSLGAPLFSAVTHTRSYKESSFIKDIERALDTGSEEINLFLFGSIFGGTGAALFPNLARDIRERLYRNKDPQLVRERVHISGVLLLPFFKFPDQEPGQGEQTERGALPDRVQAADFFRKSKEAVDYYKKQEDLVCEPDKKDKFYVFDSLYLMGMSPLIQTCDKYCKGGPDQIHRYHVVDLFAALAACDFFGHFDGETTGKRIYVPQLSNEAVESIGWDQLPGAETKKKLLSFMRFSAFMITTLSPFFSQKDAALRDLPLMQHLYGKKGLLHPQALFEAEEIERLRSAVRTVTETCRDFVLLMKDLRVTCELFEANSVDALLGQIKMERYLSQPLYGIIRPVGLRATEDVLTPDDILRSLAGLPQLRGAGKREGNEPANLVIELSYRYCSI